ncbi:MAG: HDOD domain-containing protein [Planctomycetota bacterium]
MAAPHQSPPLLLHDLRERLLERVRCGRIELPLLNASATQVVSVCSESSCDAKRLADILQRDPALAGHVLRVANSAAYAPREPIVSLQQAISRLGFDVMCDIALAVAVKGKIFDAKGFEGELRVLWIHSATAGVWAKEVARMRRKSVEGAFLSGLLHDVGKPVVLQASLELFREAGVPPHEAAIHTWMDEFHADVGAQLLCRWSMPDWMQTAVRWHHEPEQAPRDVADATDVAATACLADLLAHTTANSGKTSMVELRQHHVLAQLDMYADDLDTLDERRDTVAELAQAFR